MKFCYADPPYFKNGQSKYGYPEWDKKERHVELVRQLTREYPDGWALSCNPADLQWLLPSCPEETRVCVWCKTFFQIRPTTIQYAWEPVLVYKGRKDNKRQPMVKDWLACMRAHKKGLQGAKPSAFNKWILTLLNYKNGDVLVDMFEGTKGMSKAVKEKEAQTTLTPANSAPEQAKKSKSCGTLTSSRPSDDCLAETCGFQRSPKMPRENEEIGPSGVPA
jgi:hypothetical protein